MNNNPVLRPWREKRDLREDTDPLHSGLKSIFSTFSPQPMFAHQSHGKSIAKCENESVEFGAITKFEWITCRPVRCPNSSSADSVEELIVGPRAPFSS